MILFLRLLNKIGILKYLILNLKVNIYSNKFIIPVIKGIGLKNINTTESWMANLLSKLLPNFENGTFMDVGVNIGQTLLKVRSINQQIKYIGFEPNPSALFYTNTLIKLNNFQNTTLIPVGLSNKTEVLTLKIYNNSEVDASASILKEFRPTEKVLEEKNVPVFNFNDIGSLNQFSSKISVLKIDVEGAELEVLESLSTMIQNSHPFILIEILPAYDQNNSYRIERQNKIEQLVHDFNYSIYRIIKSYDRKKVENYEYIEKFGIHNDLNKCDYIIVPKNKLDIFNKITNE